MYISYTISQRKRNGKIKRRTITEPSAQIRPLLDSIKESLDAIPMSPCVHGFVLGRSIITNAESHKQQRYVLNIDIKDFFPSISSEMLMPILGRYSLLDKSLLPWIEHLCFYRGALPQGAPTSPVLSNVYMLQVDSVFSDYASQHGFIYTRYADDLTFSGEGVKASKDEIISLVSSALQGIGLKINSKKTKLMPYYQRQVVTGIVVNNERLTLSRAKKEEIFQHIKNREPVKFTDSERGLLEYVRFVDLVFFNKLQKLFCEEEVWI